MTPQSRSLRAVEDPDEPAPPLNTSGGNGGRYDRLEERLRNVELDVREIKTRTENSATKQDLKLATANLQKWALGGAFGGVAAVLGWLVYWVIRTMTAASPPGG